MIEVFPAPGWLNVIVFGILFGFGFAIGGWLWAKLVSLASRKG